MIAVEGSARRDSPARATSTDQTDVIVPKYSLARQWESLLDHSDRRRGMYIRSVSLPQSRRAEKELGIVLK